MNYCYNCGNKLEDNAYVCPKCGVLVKKDTTNNTNVDTGSFGWGILGFFVPLVGLVLYLSWRDDRPKDAKKAGLGALISTIIYAVFIVLFVILFTILAVNVNSTNTRENDWYDQYGNYYKFE